MPIERGALKAFFASILAKSHVGIAYRTQTTFALFEAVKEAEPQYVMYFYDAISQVSSDRVLRERGKKAKTPDDLLEILEEESGRIFAALPIDILSANEEFEAENSIIK